jgi:hypothetical protein
MPFASASWRSPGTELEICVRSYSFQKIPLLSIGLPPRPSGRPGIEHTCFAARRKEENPSKWGGIGVRALAALRECAQNMTPLETMRPRADSRAEDGNGQFRRPSLAGR